MSFLTRGMDGWVGRIGWFRWGRMKVSHNVGWCHLENRVGVFRFVLLFSHFLSFFLSFFALVCYPLSLQCSAPKFERHLFVCWVLVLWKKCHLRPPFFFPFPPSSTILLL